MSIDPDPRVEVLHGAIAELRDGSEHRGYMVVDCVPFVGGWPQVILERVIGPLLFWILDVRDDEGRRAVRVEHPTRVGEPSVSFTLNIALDGAEYPGEFWDDEPAEETFRKLLLDRRLPFGNDVFDLRWLDDQEREQVIAQTEWMSLYIP